MITAVVEGESDVGMVKALIGHCGYELDRVVVSHGKTRLDPKIPNYWRAAVRRPWVVFRDSDTKCPVSEKARLWPAPDGQEAPLFRLNLVHPMTEAWLLADRESFAAHFKVKVTKIATAPEGLTDAKQHLLNLARTSRDPDVRAMLVRPAGGPGPLYVHLINEFATAAWRPAVAATLSPSLAGAIARIRSLPGR